MAALETVAAGIYCRDLLARVRLVDDWPATTECLNTKVPPAFLITFLLFEQKPELKTEELLRNSDVLFQKI